MDEPQSRPFFPHLFLIASICCQPEAEKFRLLREQHFRTDPLIYCGVSFCKTHHIAERVEAMPTIQKQVHLNVPAPVVYRYLSDPVHVLAFCPAVSDVYDIVRHPSSDTHFMWKYNMIGVRFEGEAILKEPKHNAQIYMQISGGIHASVSWMLARTADGVDLTILVEYTVPKPLLRSHSEEIVIRANIHTVECVLENLKMLLEVDIQQPIGST